MHIKNLFDTLTFRSTTPKPSAYVGTVRGRDEEATKLRLEMARSAVKYAEHESDLRLNERIKAKAAYMAAVKHDEAQMDHLETLRGDLRALEASILP